MWRGEREREREKEGGEGHLGVLQRDLRLLLPPGGLISTPAATSGLPDLWLHLSCCLPPHNQGACSWATWALRKPLQNVARREAQVEGHPQA